MTTIEFKQKFPQYKDLEGNELWDKMTEVFLNTNEVLTADPNREIIYHEPITLLNGVIVSVEDSSKTRWLNSKGEEVFLKEDAPMEKPTESYRMNIIDFGEKEDENIQ